MHCSLVEYSRVKGTGSLWIKGKLRLTRIVLDRESTVDRSNQTLHDNAGSGFSKGARASFPDVFVLQLLPARVQQIA